ncbi:MAG: DUF3299 domain-containing protein [Candidatus Electrothrix aestuarii]|jgi:hypothetical protein|uniref:DUF3299 domain-containing protein n=1 Tax=Candidatus Electrothrix aestuarii TaxID=3062594 RepID=A0AAU8LZP7_9BACT|nr:DUF3299 domain-containing protein [Candidatus Electrothrix aestuarii]
MKIFLCGILLFFLSVVSFVVMTDIPLPYLDSYPPHPSPRGGETKHIDSESNAYSQNDQNSAGGNEKLALAGEIQNIEWKDLIPPPDSTVDPLAALSGEERDYVEWIIYLRQELAKKNNEGTFDEIVGKVSSLFKKTSKEDKEREQKLFNEMTAALPELKKKGIDVDKIIAERQMRKSALNKELDGKQVRLGGYILPLEQSRKKIREFLLVPFVGACIHVPPPPPNQIVYAVSEEPISYTINDIFRSVVVTGRLTAKAGSKELFLVDGSSDIDIGYVMEAEAIDRYLERSPEW